MKSSAKNIVLKSVDDIFQTEENRVDAQRERVQEIPLDQLKPFKIIRLRCATISGCSIRRTASVNMACLSLRLRDLTQMAAMS